MQFIKTILAVLTALVIFTVLGIIFFLTIISFSLDDKVINIKENSILKINLKGPLKDQEVDNPFENFGFHSGASRSVGLVSLVQTIKKASSDDKIKGIVIEPGLYYQGYSGLEELRNSLIQFRDSGKFVVSWAENYSEKGYYLASASDEVYMAPEGYFEFNGLNASVIFFKKFFEKYDIEPEIFRVGEYKSAVEPFLREDLSPENREQLASLLNSIDQYNLSKIAESRNIPFENVVSASKEMKVHNAEEAYEQKLIDGVIFKDEFIDLMKKKMEVEKEEDLNIISYSAYSSQLKKGSSENQIAIVIAEGQVMPGNSPDELSSGYITKFLKKVREDEKVKAVVLRINSPGGEMQSSELIWREVKLTAEKKPVIASFSNLAASGGYYIAMGADSIVAEPTTITGSIGIFGMMFNFGDMLDKQLGITFDEVNTGDFSGMMTVNRSLTEAEREVIQKQVNKGYDTFIQRVADGRKTDKEKILAVASGRVWSGLQALDNGLVDALGGLET
ncbi:MAG: signal peptide peptidase SppA, partial [Cyclobacteriaceae bacterium]|nr:signal peptide peptidase SppA [Cyclobacteriaceae bacterium]